MKPIFTIFKHKFFETAAQTQTTIGIAGLPAEEELSSLATTGLGSWHSRNYTRGIPAEKFHHIFHRNSPTIE
jgi:hypothetical protein